MASFITIEVEVGATVSPDAAGSIAHSVKEFVTNLTGQTAEVTARATIVERAA
jgi:hypothetical protein